MMKLDLFSRTQDDYRIRTLSGSIVSLLTIILMIYLFYSEILYYNSTLTKEKLIVTKNHEKLMSVEFDITFPSMSCSILSVDILDEYGQMIMGVNHDIYKRSLGFDGFPIGEAVKDSIGNSLKQESDLMVGGTAEDHRAAMNFSQCGDCYGAGAPGECCNTCDDVRNAFNRKNWILRQHGIVQCTTEAHLEDLRSNKMSTGGCQVFGTIEVPQTSGHFHITPHSILSADFRKRGILNLKDLLTFTFQQFNITHTINVLSFGHQFPGIKTPLEGQSRVIEDTHGMHQYFLKIVPTLFLPSDAKKVNSNSLDLDEEFLIWDGEWKNAYTNAIESNSYSVTESLSHLSPGSGRGLPGLYFYYDVSPIQSVIFYEKRRGSVRGSGFLPLITSACSLLGGAYVLMGLTDRLLNYINKKFFNDKFL